jgi:hypothetical protein
MAGRLRWRKQIISLRRCRKLSCIREVAENGEKLLSALVVIFRHLVENCFAEAENILGQQAVRQILDKRRADEILQEPHVFHTG